MSPTKSTIKPWPFWANEGQKLKCVLAGLENFSATQSCWNSSYTMGLAIDDRMRRLCLFNLDKATIHRQMADFPDIVRIEVIEDGRILRSTPATNSPSHTTTQPATLKQWPQDQSPRTPGDSVDMVAIKLTIEGKAFSASRLPTAPPLTSDVGQQHAVHIIKVLDKKVSRGSSTHRDALDKASHWFKVMLALQHIGSLKIAPALKIAVP